MKELQEKAAKAQKVSEKFSQAMMGLAIAAAPLVDIFAFFADILVVMTNPLGEIARLLNFSDGVVAGFGVLTVTVMSFLAAMKIYTIVMGMAGAANTGFAVTLAAAFWPVTAGIAAFAGLYIIIRKLPKMLQKVVAPMLAIAAATALVFAFTPLGPALTLQGAALAAVIGTLLAGTVASVQAFDLGKQAGQEVPGGVGLVGEKGPEKMKTKDGQEYMVNSPSVVPLGRDDEVTSRKDTAAESAAGGGALDQTISYLAEVVASLSAAVTTANTPSADEKAGRPIVIELDKKKVGEANEEYLQKKSSLRLA
jgi:hypothetical protein